MWFGYRLPHAVAYTGNAEICSGFPPPQAALRIILSNEGDVVYIDIDTGVWQVFTDFFKDFDQQNKVVRFISKYNPRRSTRSSDLSKLL